MTKQLHAEIDIRATPERVWQILTDFAAFADWNPFMTQASGLARAGERLRIRMRPQEGRAMTFRPKVLDAQPGRRLRWLGRLGLPGLFDGEHTFTIEPVGEGTVRFVQYERFRGLLVPFVARSVIRRTQPAFERMNQALKRRAEQPQP